MPINMPSSFVNWVPDGASNNLAVPPVAISKVGFQPSQPVPAQWLNYIVRTLDQWNQFLAEGINSTVLATSLDHSMRLLGGGTWSYSSATGVLAWSQPFQLACPSAPDSNNQAAAGQVTLPPGSVAYVTANLPFSTIGDVTADSVTIENLGYEGGIALDQVVFGAGISQGTTVVAIDGSSCTLSAPATASGTQQSLTFVGSGPLNVTAASGSALVPGPNTVIIARSVGPICSVGIGSNEMWLRDREVRSLETAGYVTTFAVPAGQDLAVNQAVYISGGAGDAGRTSGAAYLAEASAANQAMHRVFAGFVQTAAASDETVQIVSSGVLGGFMGLSRGSAYYLDPTIAGGITPTRPTTVGQAIVPVGIALSDSTLFVHLGIGGAISNTFKDLTVNGRATINPEVAGPAISGTNLAKSATTWAVTDTGASSFASVASQGPVSGTVLSASQSVVSPLGFRHSYSMGSYAHGAFPGAANPVALYRTDAIQQAGAPPTFTTSPVYVNMETSGSIIAISGTVYGVNLTQPLDLYVYRGSINTGDGSQPQQIYIKATVIPYNGHFNATFPKGQYAYTAGTSFRMRFGYSVTGVNVAFDAYLVVESAA